MTSLAQALSAALLHFVWQGALVGVLLWIALLILRNRSAAVRYAAACGALAVLAMLPAVTMWLLYQAPPPVSTGPAFSVPAAGVQAVSSSAGPWIGSLLPWALPVWSLGVFLLSLRLVLSSLQVYRLRRSGATAGSEILAAVDAVARRMRLARPVRVLISALADGPTVIGWLRPVILLPSAAMLGLTEQQLEAVLAHELAHIRRCDYLVNLLQMAIETLLFYHPAVWWASSRIRHERELCCDDLAVASCGDALCYARALTRLERLRIATPAMALGSTGGPLAFRIRRLMGLGAAASGPSKIPGLLALVAGLACFALNIHWANGQEQASPSPKQRREAELVDEKKAMEQKLLEEHRAREAGSVKSGNHVFLRRPAPDNVKVDTGGAVLLHRTGVAYPHAAVEKRIEGVVAVEASLDAAGNVDDARVLSGPIELRRAALESVLQWHFAAGSGGSTRLVNIDFKLPAATEGVAVTFTLSARTEEPQEEASAMRLLEKQIAEAHQKAGQVNDSALIRELEAMRAGQAAQSGTGSTLSAIRIEGLPDALRNELQARIPVHPGEALTKESIERTNTAVRQFDEHLEVRVRPSGERQAELVIVAPAAEPERVRGVRRQMP